jgi:hypothetical protein
LFSAAACFTAASFCVVKYPLQGGYTPGDTWELYVATPRSALMNWNRKRTMILCAVMFLATVPALPQNPELQQKLAAAKQAAAENKQKLLQYQWTETTQLTLKGDAKPPTKNLCQYGPDGKVQKTAIGPPPEQPSGGRMKQKVIAKKKAEMKDYMQDVKAVLGMYVPPDPQKMQAAYQSGKLSLNPVPGAVNLVFADCWTMKFPRGE